MVISCDDCVMQHTAACADCVVTHVLGADRGVVLDVAAERVVRLLVRAGLVPRSRHRGVLMRAGHGGVAARTLARCAAPPPCRPSTSCARIAAEHGIEHLGVAPATSSTGPAALHERRDRGLAAGMGFTYRNPDRSTDPRRAVPGARSILVAARSYLPTRSRPTAGPRRASPATPGSTTTPRCGPGCGRSPAGCGPPIERAVAFADDNSIVDREVAYRAGLGWFGKNANLLLPGAGSWFVLGCVVTTAPLPVADRRRRRRLRLVPALPRRLPDGRDRRPGRDRRQPLPGVGAAEARRDPGRRSGRRSATASTAATTARRCARRPSASAGATARPLRRGRRGRGSTCSTCSRRRRDAARPSRALVPRRPRSALAAPQRARGPRQHRADPATARSTPRWPATRRRRRRAAPSTPAGRSARSSPGQGRSPRSRPGRDGRGAVKHLLVTNDFPPKIGGIQSLLWEWWRRLPPDRSPC